MHRQLILNISELFTPQSKIDFYTKVFDSLNLSSFPDKARSSMSGPEGFSRHALFRAFMVMKYEKFLEVSQLQEYLYHNQIIAHLCGFDISTIKLPSYWTFRRFIKNTANEWFKDIMQLQVKELRELGFIDGSFASLDSTSIEANTAQNNPKSFDKKRFDKTRQPKSDKDCKLGIRTASNAFNDKKLEFYWGYKNHILVDAILGLPIAEITTTANTTDHEVAVSLLKETHKWFSLDGTYFIGDKAYDVRDIYNYVYDDLNDHCFIPINPRNSKKDRKTLASGNLLCDAGLAMHKDGRQYLKNSIKQKFCCPFRFPMMMLFVPVSIPSFSMVKRTGAA